MEKAAFFQLAVGILGAAGIIAIAWYQSRNLSTEKRSIHRKGGVS